MPYVPPEDRPPLDTLIDMVTSALHDHEPLERLGRMNYTLTRIVMGAIPQPARYHWLVAYRGVLSDVKDEMYRRYVAPYEDKAIAKNGDVPEYAEET